MQLAIRATAVAALATSLLAAGSAAAQQATTTAAKPAATTKHHKTSSQASLRAAAKISEDSARTVALAQVPNGTVKSGELEREHGKLIYSFDIAVAGRSGIEEVNVDAGTGAVVAHEHEGPKAERKEAAQEAKERGATRTRHAASAAPHDSAASHP